ncbi:MAG: TRAP transporter fused permease subunit [Deltaproteobacteria bacterium]|nr:MAG: TRAP transporter fused permease subunit [Deltaproteobacteria bacterium]
MHEKIDRYLSVLVTIFAVSLSVISLYTAFFGIFETIIQRTLHLAIVFIIALFIYRLKMAKRHPWIDLSINVFLGVLFALANIYLVLNWKELYISPFLTTTGLILGLAAIAIILELTRRTIGWALVIIVLIFIGYTYFGNYIPGFLAHRGYNLERIVVQVFAGTEGIYSTPVGVCATIVIIFILFGSFVEVSGASSVFLNIATSVAGRQRGGPAKIAVFASGLMGMLSGSPAANVATTGAVTIPMMKKSGVEPYIAGAIESVASSGGYKTPPIMGAVAFIMAQMLGMSYWEVCIAAALPAFFHYFGLFLMVDFHAGQKGFRGLPGEEVPKFLPALKKGFFFVIPVGLLIALLAARYSAMFACAYSLLSLWIIAIFAKTLSISKVISALRDGAVRMIMITIPCAAAGIILGLLTLTGVGMKLSEIIDFLAGGSLLFTLFWIMIISIVLGMGLPPVVSYIVLAALEVPILVEMGVNPIAAHLFIFYFCTLSLITPPVCTTAFTAAAIAGSHPMKTGLEAVRFGIVLYTLPYLFVYNPALIMKGSLLDILFVFLIAGIGIFSLAIGAQGYLLESIGWWKRFFFVLASILIFWPSYTITIVGLLLLIILVVVERRVSHKTLPQVET